MVLKHIKKGHPAGFTLMELLVVIAILAIMSTIALPMVKNMIPDQRLRSGSLNIVSCLQEVKLRAVKENTVVVIVFDLVNNSYTAFVDNGPGAAGGNRTLDAGEAIVRREALPPGIDLYFSNFTADTFAFNGLGMPATTVGRVGLQNAIPNYREIIVSTAGNIRVQKSSDGVNWN